MEIETVSETTFILFHLKLSMILSKIFDKFRCREDWTIHFTRKKKYNFVISNTNFNMSFIISRALHTKPLKRLTRNINYTKKKKKEKEKLVSRFTTKDFVFFLNQAQLSKNLTSPPRELN